MSLTVAVLSWGAHETLLNSLESYKIKGLLNRADQLLIFFQEVTEADEWIAQQYGFDYIGSPTNIGIAGGYKRLLEETTSDLFLFLENDWEITTYKDYVSPILEQAITFVENNKVDVARLRSRHKYGYPLWTLQFEGHEMDKPTHLLDSVHWMVDPRNIFIKNIASWQYPFYVTTAKHANWTNNPTISRKEFLLKHIYPRLGGDIERNIQDWWETQTFKVGQGEGLFTHNRIG